MAATFSCLKLALFSRRLEVSHRRPAASPPKASKITMSDRRAYWASVEADITTDLTKSLPSTPPPVVAEPLRHLVSAAPRAMAPALCIAACELVGGHRADAMAAACALHLMHAAAYTHGRLPALLGRKHQPAAYSDGVELMTGDAILPLGYEVAAGSEGGGDPERVLRVIIEIAGAMGPAGMLAGQLMEAEGGEDVAAWVERKEGRLSACGAACGAILGGGDEEAVERLRRWGMYAGMMHGLLLSPEGRVEAAEEMRSKARTELEGFSEGGEGTAISGLVDLWFEDLMMMRGGGGDRVLCGSNAGSA